jgi:hypothetical protein
MVETKSPANNLTPHKLQKAKLLRELKLKLVFTEVTDVIKNLESTARIRYITKQISDEMFKRCIKNAKSTYLLKKAHYIIFHIFLGFLRD